MEQSLGGIEGIHLPMSNRGQIIAQYVDDISFSLKASREGMIQLGQLFGLQINQAKSEAFWIGG
jgi:hypothetical protein